MTYPVQGFYFFLESLHAVLKRHQLAPSFLQILLTQLVLHYKLTAGEKYHTINWVSSSFLPLSLKLDGRLFLLSHPLTFTMHSTVGRELCHQHTTTYCPALHSLSQRLQTNLLCHDDTLLQRLEVLQALLSLVHFHAWCTSIRTPPRRVLNKPRGEARAPLLTTALATPA